MSAFDRRCARAAIHGSALGLILVLAMCIAFGVLDVQCSADPAGKFWDAAEQRCQAHEVPA